MDEDKRPGDISLPSSDAELLELIQYEDESKYPYTVEDFFKTPDETAYKISPDGLHMSFMAPWKRRRNVFIKTRGTEEKIQITFEEDRGIADYGWVNNNRVIYIKDDGGDENFKLFAVNIDGTEQKDLTPFPKVKIQIIDGLPDDDEHIILGMNKNNPMLFEPYRLNVNTGDLEQIGKNENPLEPISTWMTDHDGKLRIASKTVGGVNHCIMYRDTEGEEFTEVITTDFKTSIDPLLFDKENSPVMYVSSNIGRDKKVIILFDMKTGKEIGTPIYAHEHVDVGSLIWSRKHQKLQGIRYTHWKGETHFLDPDREALQKRWESELPGYEIVAVSKDKEEQNWILRTYSDKTLGSYYFYSAEDDTIEKITEVSPWLKEEDMCQMDYVTYPSRDGLNIPAYLTVPNGADISNIPFIIHPHGGPWARDSWGYNPICQLFASRGYGVLQMNFRGSVGFGRDFWEKSFKQWGRTMQHDITDGANWLVDRGLADPTKLAIFGGSYGGYATLAGVTYTPDLYACAIDYVGVSNLISFMETVPPYWEPYKKMLHEMVGDPEHDLDDMIAYSPAKNVEKIKVPLFISQGANDPRVNIDESDQIVKSLRDRGVEVPYMVKYDEGHGFSNEENRFDFYKAMMGFLAKHL